MTESAHQNIDPAAAPQVQRASELHFLHIGKTAGNQIGQLAAQLNKDGQGPKIVRHGHLVQLYELDPATPYFFSVRDPVSRFRSAFYSRRRKGRPLGNYEWSDDERIAFERFDHANDLAEALFSGGERGRAATAAILSVTHCSMNQAYWVMRAGNFLQTRPPVWIVRQEAFEADFRELARRADHCGRYEVVNDPVLSHRNDYTDTPPLSDLARQNLRRWYVQDYAFVACCEAWMAQSLGQDLDHFAIYGTGQ